MVKNRGKSWFSPFYFFFAVSALFLMASPVEAGAASLREKREEVVDILCSGDLEGAKRLTRVEAENLLERLVARQKAGEQLTKGDGSWLKSGLLPSDNYSHAAHLAVMAYIDRCTHEEREKGRENESSDPNDPEKEEAKDPLTDYPAFSDFMNKDVESARSAYALTYAKGEESPMLLIYDEEKGRLTNALMMDDEGQTQALLTDRGDGEQTQLYYLKGSRFLTIHFNGEDTCQLCLVEKGAKGPTVIWKESFVADHAWTLSEAKATMKSDAKAMLKAKDQVALKGQALNKLDWYRDGQLHPELNEKIQQASDRLEEKPGIKEDKLASQVNFCNLTKKGQTLIFLREGMNVPNRITISPNKQEITLSSQGGDPSVYTYAIDRIRPIYVPVWPDGSAADRLPSASRLTLMKWVKGQKIAAIEEGKTAFYFCQDNGGPLTLSTINFAENSESDQEGVCLTYFKEGPEGGSDFSQ